MFFVRFQKRYVLRVPIVMPCNWTTVNDSTAVVRYSNWNFFLTSTVPAEVRSAGVHLKVSTTQIALEERYRQLAQIWWVAPRRELGNKGQLCDDMYQVSLGGWSFWHGQVVWIQSLFFSKTKPKWPIFPLKCHLFDLVVQSRKPSDR